MPSAPTNWDTVFAHKVQWIQALPAEWWLSGGMFRFTGDTFRRESHQLGFCWIEAGR